MSIYKKLQLMGRLSIEYLLFSTRNVVAVQEEMAQFNDLFKILLSPHEKYNALIEDEARVKDDKYFDEIKTRYFPLRRDYYAC